MPPTSSSACQRMLPTRAERNASNKALAYICKCQKKVAKDPNWGLPPLHEHKSPFITPSEQAEKLEILRRRPLHQHYYYIEFLNNLTELISFLRTDAKGQSEGDTWVKIKLQMWFTNWKLAIQHNLSVQYFTLGDTYIEELRLGYFEYLRKPHGIDEFKCFDNFADRLGRGMVRDDQRELLAMALESWVNWFEGCLAALAELEKEGVEAVEKVWQRFTEHVEDVGAILVPLVLFFLNLRSESIEARIWRYLQDDSGHDSDNDM
ncbi:hypothetical protein BJ508DRAFT_35039 [Ascobolus immersus RN42]|uniref:Uncharacterized protein n=1 Tax=Ascobolus immersus RN42 TaxID=1160509 RepID=A0A3N4HXS5_ASCIM|nr:hypothetical protein BJ508DRAFT_35039 [Ascobolus immersus RN42]